MPILYISGWGFPWKGNAIQGGGYYGIFESQSIQGGGYYGIFESQSIQGGGSVSGVPISFSSSDRVPRYARVGFFVKVAALPASDMTLVDLNAGSTGYFRIKLTSSGRVVAEGALVATNNLTLNPTTALATGIFYFVSAKFGSTRGVDHGTEMSGLVAGPGGITDGLQIQYVDGFPSTYAVDTTAILGWGVRQSSGYLNFPGTSGNELSKLEGSSGTSNASEVGYFGAPGSDVSTSGLDYLYLCRQAVGVASSLIDSTTNHFDLTPGSNDLTVVADGPYP